MFRKFATLFIALVLLIAGPQFVYAANDLDESIADDQFHMDGETDYNDPGVNKQMAAFTGKQGADFGRVRDPREAVARIVQAFLVLLGMLFMVYAIYAGYLILTSAGNEDRVEKGKSILKNTTIGLIIVLSAYGATWIVRWTFVATGDDAYKNCNPPAYEEFLNDPASPHNTDDEYINC